MIRQSIFELVRAARNGKSWTDPDIAILDQALDKLGVPRNDAAPAPLPPADEPRWVAISRQLLGTREVVGPAHNNFISKGWARLGAGWFNDDETPWCGFFVAHCIDAAGLEYPGKGAFARAKAWLDWGKPCRPVLGAVTVFGRDGGGHVGFLVGTSADNLYILGGNQGNQVSITPLAKSRALGFRWPSSLPVSTTMPPPMSGGTVSRNEA
jgi:uncharacterized protein (TIGR02594 family)